jgi:hypothetical protein
VLLALTVAGAITLAAMTSSLSAAATAGCSKEAASQIATRLHVGVDPGTGRTPIAQVLCGPFFGRDSKGMAASVAVPTGCGVSTEWAVFRFATNAWQRVMVRPNGVLRLDAVGSGIRETMGVLQANDPNCHPSVLRSRVWHWNGSRFLATAWKITAASTGGGHLALREFASPSRNLGCEVGDEDKVYCQSFNPPHSAALSSDGTIIVCNARICGGSAKATGIPTLGYGERNEYAGYLCVSEMKGITCTVATPGKGYGKGFLINAAGVTRVGPR